MNMEEERGKEEDEELSTGTQKSGRIQNTGLKVCPIFKGHIEVIIIQLHNFFLFHHFFPFLSNGHTSTVHK